MVPELSVVGILRAVFQIYMIQAAHCVKVTASQEDDSVLFGGFGSVTLSSVK